MKYLTIAAAMLASTGHAGGLSDPIVQPPAIGTPAHSSGWGGIYAGLSFGRTDATTTREYERIEATSTEIEVPVYDVCRDNGGHSGGDKCAGDREHIDLTFGPDMPFHEHWTQTGLYGGNQNRAFLRGEDVTIVDSQGNVLGTGVTDGTNPTGTLYRLETGQTKTIAGPDLVETFIDVVTEGDEGTDVGGFIGARFDITPTFVGGIEATSDGTLTTGELHLGLNLGDLLPYAGVGAGQYDGEGGTVYVAGADLRVTDSMFIGGKYSVGEFSDTDTETLGLRVGFTF